MLSVWQWGLLFAYLVFYTLETRGSETLFLYAGAPAIGGIVSGLICGNQQVGFWLGAVLQLATLGITEFGGAPQPDYHMGIVLGVLVSSLTDRSVSSALLVGLPVAFLMPRLDKPVRVLVGKLVRSSRMCTEEGKLRKAYGLLLLGGAPYLLRNLLPVAAVWIIGQPFLARLIACVPEFVMGSLSVAGRFLPMMGLAVLLRCLPVREYIPYFLIGFVLCAGLRLPLQMLALLAAAAAWLSYRDEAAPEQAVSEDDEDEL